MEWSDEAIVLNVRPYGETSGILDALTRLHGRHAGLVRGGASSKGRAVLQSGNRVRSPGARGSLRISVSSPSS